MQKMTRNFVSISFALALCGGMVFAQVAEEPAPNTWGVPSATNGTFTIGVQTVYEGFIVTTPFKTHNTTTDKWEDADSIITEDDDADQVALISLAGTYDNSNASGVGYSFGASGGIKRVNNNGGDSGFTGYFDAPWGKFFFFDKQLTLRAGSLEELWKAWDDNWDYGPFDGGVQLNVNPSFLSGGLNVGVSLPVRINADKADYPFKNMVAGFKLGGAIPYTTISAALKLKEAGPVVKSTTMEDDTMWTWVSNGTIYEWKEVAIKKSVKEYASSMDMTAALDFNFSPIHIMAELQLANFDQDDDELENNAPPVGDDRQAKFRFHPRLELSLSSLADLGAFSLGTFAVWSWIQDDQTYKSSGTSVSISWEPSYKLSSAITASMYLEGQYGGGDAPLLEGTALDDYNKIGFYARPAVAFSIAPNAEIRLRDQITFAAVGTPSEAGIQNAVQVRFYWGF
jgi:hypothetical protein